MTRSRCVRCVPRELREALGEVGNLKTNVVAESASPHSSLLPLHQAHLSRTDRDDQDLIHPLPVDLSSPVISSKQPLGTRVHEILQTREEGRRNSLRAASEHIKGAPLQALQPGPGADISASKHSPCAFTLLMTCIKHVVRAVPVPCRGIADMCVARAGAGHKSDFAARSTSQRSSAHKDCLFAF